MIGFALIVFVGLILFCVAGTVTAALCVPRLRSGAGCLGAIFLGGGAGAVVFFALCSLLGALADRNVNELVSEAQVVGTWSMTDGSRAHFVRDNLLADPEARCFIEFRADGTCTFDSPLDHTSPARISASGSWQLVHDTYGDSSEKVRNALKLQLGNQGGSSHYLYFTRGIGGKDSLMLWNYYTDPDACQYVEYARKP